MKTLLSACFVGIHTPWNGGTNKVDDLVEWVKAGCAVFLCPEQLGGLTTPREPAEIESGKTAKDVLEGKARGITNTGRDVTEQFVWGAKGAGILSRDRDRNGGPGGHKPLVRLYGNV